MADSKITALTALTAADPVNDMFPVVDVSDTTMAASGTTKKISVNNILGASGTATLASATITGDLTVDTNVLKVDTTLNRVGIGTATPANTFQVIATTGIAADFAGTGAAGFQTIARIRTASANSNGFLIQGNNTTDEIFINNFYNGALLFGTNNVERYRIDNTGIATWSVAGTTAMTLNSTGLGVGIAPVAYSDKSVTLYGSTTSELHLITGNTGSLSSDGVSIGITSGNELLIFNREAAAIRFGTNNTDVMRIDSSGNVGVGITPSAWATSTTIWRALDMQYYCGLASSGAGSGEIDLLWNAYYDQTDQRWEFKYTGDRASRYSIGGAGVHTWYNTASTGTANNPITWNPAMTLDASGNLMVGVASSGNRLEIQKSTDCTLLVKSSGANTNIAMDYVSNYGNHTIRKSGTAVWDFGVINDSSATPAFKISNGSSAVGVQLVSGATAWTTLSDETVKDIIEPITNAITKVGSLRSVIGKFKTDDASKRRSFLIAQDVLAVLPEAVDVVGEKNELGVRYSDVIPLLVAAIKELTAEVNALKNA